MRDLVLTGFMGTGKTTVARLLAHRFGLTLVDTDEEIELRAGCSVAEVFRRYGEDGFRRLETEVLKVLTDGEGRVIASGGGSFLEAANRALIQADQTVICLSCDVPELQARLAGLTDRPLLPRGQEQIADLLAARMDSYLQFTQVETTGKSANEVAYEVGRQARLAHAGQLSFDRSDFTELIFERGGARMLGHLLQGAKLLGHAVVVTDETVASLGLLDSVMASLREVGLEAHSVTLPPGEAHKTLATLESLYGHCMELRLDREAVIVGLGGGVICDLAGSLAATYLRGLSLVLVPTTLLAQVDAAIGGKVAVDFRHAKNLIGAFHPAMLVVDDPDLLSTLPSSALADGLAEVVKIATVRSAPLLALLENLHAPEQVHANPAIIRRAALEKTRVVQRDPYDRGERALLNFGHTIGHAVEAASDYCLSHGHAVSVGMVAETWMAARLGFCSGDLPARLSALVSRLGLPRRARGVQADVALSFMCYDKKRASDGLRFALPTGPGTGAVFRIGEADARTAIQYAVGAGA